jgi:hypothetical protein
MQPQTPVTDPLDRRRPRVTAVLVAGAGLVVAVPFAVVAAAVVEFSVQARKVVRR